MAGWRAVELVGGWVGGGVAGLEGGWLEGGGLLEGVGGWTVWLEGVAGGVGGVAGKPGERWLGAGGGVVSGGQGWRVLRVFGGKEWWWLVAGRGGGEGGLGPQYRTGPCSAVPNRTVPKASNTTQYIPQHTAAKQYRTVPILNSHANLGFPKLGVPYWGPYYKGILLFGGGGGGGGVYVFGVRSLEGSGFRV